MLPETNLRHLISKSPQKVAEDICGKNNVFKFSQSDVSKFGLFSMAFLTKTNQFFQL